MVSRPAGLLSRRGRRRGFGLVRSAGRWGRFFSLEVGAKAAQAAGQGGGGSGNQLPAFLVFQTCILRGRDGAYLRRLICGFFQRREIAVETRLSLRLRFVRQGQNKPPAIVGKRFVLLAQARRFQQGAFGSQQGGGVFINAALRKRGLRLPARRNAQTQAGEQRGDGSDFGF